MWHRVDRAGGQAGLLDVCMTGPANRGQQRSVRPRAMPVNEDSGPTTDRGVRRDDRGVRRLWLENERARCRGGGGGGGTAGRQARKQRGHHSSPLGGLEGGRTDATPSTEHPYGL